MSRADRPALLALAASFAAGALAVWWLDRHFSPQSEQRIALSDAQLRERARMLVADLVRDPDAIDVEVEDAVVRVRGLVAAAEMDALLMNLAGMPGVSRVRNALSARETTPGETETS